MPQYWGQAMKDTDGKALGTTTSGQEVSNTGSKRRWSIWGQADQRQQRGRVSHDPLTTANPLVWSVPLEQGPVPGLNDIQNAYVIAVEEQARQRLEHLSALHKVRPVDISNVGTTFAAVSGNVTASSVFNSCSSEAGKSTYVSHTPRASISGNNSNCFLPETGAVPPPPPPPAHSQLPRAFRAEGSVESVASTSGISESEESLSGAGTLDSMDAGVSNGYLEAGAMPQGRVDQPRYAMNGALKDANRIAGGTPNKHNVIPQYYQYDQHDMQVSKENVYESDTELNDSGPHREMAIDVPANFIGKAKEPPRFPTNRGSPKGSAQNSPVKRPPEYGSSRTRNWAENITPYDAPPILTPQEKVANEEKIRHYQDELRKQREEKSRMAREEEFLRTSLRGSKKLQALEEIRQEQALARPPASGVVNPNFICEEDAYDGSTLPMGSRVQSSKLTGVEDLFSSLQHIQSRLEAVEDQKHVAFLSQLFHNSRFQQALDIHNKVIEVTLRSPQAQPVHDNGHQTAADILAAMAPQAGNPAVDELAMLLHKPNMKGVLYSHDKIAFQKSAEPKTSSTPGEDEEREYIYERASQYGEDSIKIVRLQKTADPLGATVRNEGNSVIIGRIVKGGAAEKSGLLHEGDEILEINGVDMKGRSVNEVCERMANMTGTLTFLIVPSEEAGYSNGTAGRDKVAHMRAHFNYDPEDDLYIPCRELGISFLKGDILHVINQEDANWWQAYREGEEDQALAGLIPSRSFQQQREAMRQTITGDSKEMSKKKHRCRCAKSSKKKKKKQLYSGAGDEAEAEEILTYEDVALYYPQPNRKRPIVLIGPPNVGRQELRQRLMESDDERFAAAIPHTSRPRKDEEEDGRDYHFVPRHKFEDDIAGQKFVEYGEFEYNLYGTSLEAIRQVINQGKICLLNLHPQSLRILKASDLKPYVVFIAPPNLEKLRMIRDKEGTKITDNDLKDIIEKAREVEDTYGHYFDMIIVNSDTDKAYEELLAEINRLEVEPQWVSAHWLS